MEDQQWDDLLGELNQNIALNKQMEVDEKQEEEIRVRHAYYDEQIR